MNERKAGLVEQQDKEKNSSMEVNLTKQDVLILAIETSCDETAASVVKNGREVLSDIIYTQIALHTCYGESSQFCHGNSAGRCASYQWAYQR